MDTLSQVGSQASDACGVKLQILGGELDGVEGIQKTLGHYEVTGEVCFPDNDALFITSTSAVTCAAPL